MASCLVETGFLTSRAEYKKLQTKEYQDKIADGIVNGIVKYGQRGIPTRYAPLEPS